MQGYAHVGTCHGMSLRHHRVSVVGSRHGVTLHDNNQINLEFVTKALSLFLSKAPFVLTPLQTSIAKGWTSSIACFILSGLSPPARYTGHFELSRICLLSFQLCTLPVPPSSFTFRFGFPLSSSNASTLSESLIARSTDVESII